MVALHVSKSMYRALEVLARHDGKARVSNVTGDDDHGIALVASRTALALADQRLVIFTGRSAEIVELTDAGRVFVAAEVS